MPVNRQKSLIQYSIFFARVVVANNQLTAATAKVCNASSHLPREIVQNKQIEKKRVRERKKGKRNGKKYIFLLLPVKAFRVY
jgi:hypothetical protein